MSIRIESAEEFKRLLENLALELVDANIYLRLHFDLGDATEAYRREFRQSWTFWSLTLQAHFDAALFRLCRIFDQHREGLNLRNFLLTIQENLCIFAEENFRERLKGNPFVDSLAATARGPDAKQLGQDIEFSGADNPLVKNLIVMRNNHFAHRSARDAISPQDLNLKYPLTKEDVQTLLKGGLEILNRYSALFDAQLYAGSIVGRDDYEGVVDAIRDKLARYDEQRKKEQERTGGKLGPA